MESKLFLKWDPIYFPNVPIFRTKLTGKVIDRLWNYIDESTENWNSNLAGNITKSLKLIDKDNYFYTNVLEKLVYEYTNPSKCGVYWNSLTTSKVHTKFVLDNMWVNFQNKHEFNPIHDHSGVVSFIVWLKIPTNWQDQFEKVSFSKHSNNPVVSNVQFQYTDILGQIQSFTVGMGSHLENHMFVFPSKLKHQVYPFYDSDETRISISGNVSLDSTNFI